MITWFFFFFGSSRYEDQLGRENRLIDEEMEEGFDETHDFAEEVALRKKTLFVYNLSPNVTTHNM